MIVRRLVPVRISGMQCAHACAELNSLMQDLTAAVNALLPGMAPAIQRVWEGERDMDELVASVYAINESDDSGRAYVSAAIEQLLTCTAELERQCGTPSEGDPVSQAKLARCVRNVGVVESVVRAYILVGEEQAQEEQGEEAEEEEKVATKASS
jgi:hypothetical protein